MAKVAPALLALGVELPGRSRCPQAVFPRQRIFSGLFVPPITPFASDGSVDIAKIHDFAKALIHDGVGGVFCNGTLGESASLSCAERRACAEAWTTAIRAAGADKKVIVHIGTQNLPETKELAAHAEALKVDAIACMAPVFFRPADVNSLVQWLAAVAQAAPKTPFLFYHFPTMSGLPFRVLDIVQQCEARIPTFRGLKFTSRDYGDLNALLRYYPDLDIMPAYDDQFRNHAELGCDAYISGLFNFAAPLYLTILSRSKAGSRSELEQAMCQLTDLCEAMEQLGVGPHCGGFGAAVRHLVGLRLGE
eukprot:RCo037998